MQRRKKVETYDDDSSLATAPPSAAAAMRHPAAAPTAKHSTAAAHHGRVLVHLVHWHAAAPTAAAGDSLRSTGRGMSLGAVPMHGTAPAAATPHGSRLVAAPASAAAGPRLRPAAAHNTVAQHCPGSSSSTASTSTTTIGSSLLRPAGPSHTARAAPPAARQNLARVTAAPALVAAATVAVAPRPRTDHSSSAATPLAARPLSLSQVAQQPAAPNHPAPAAAQPVPAAAPVAAACNGVSNGLPTSAAGAWMLLAARAEQPAVEVAASGGPLPTDGFYVHQWQQQQQQSLGSPAAQQRVRSPPASSSPHLQQQYMLPQQAPPVAAALPGVPAKPAAAAVPARPAALFATAPAVVAAQAATAGSVVLPPAAEQAAAPRAVSPPAGGTAATAPNPVPQPVVPAAAAPSLAVVAPAAVASVAAEPPVAPPRSAFRTAASPLFAEADEADAWPAAMPQPLPPQVLLAPAQLSIGGTPRRPSSSPSCPMAADEPSLSRQQPLLSVSDVRSGDFSPHGSPCPGAESGGVAPTGFGSVLQFASEESSRRNSLAPVQAAAALALVAEAMATAAGVRQPLSALSGDSDDAAAGQGWAGQAGAASQLAAKPTAPVAQLAAVEEHAAAAPLPPTEATEGAEAAAEPKWAAEPATTFQTVSKPLFGSVEYEAAVFDELAAPEQQPPATSFAAEDAENGTAAGAPQPWEQAGTLLGWGQLGWQQQLPEGQPAPVKQPKPSQEQKQHSWQPPEQEWQAPEPATEWQHEQQPVQWQPELVQEQPPQPQPQPANKQQQKEQALPAQEWQELPSLPEPASQVAAADLFLQTLSSTGQQPQALPTQPAEPTWQAAQQLQPKPVDFDTWEAAAATASCAFVSDVAFQPFSKEQPWDAPPIDAAAAKAAPGPTHAAPPVPQRTWIPASAPAAPATGPQPMPAEPEQQQQPPRPAVEPLAEAAGRPPLPAEPAGTELVHPPVLDSLDLDSPAMLAAAATSGFCGYLAQLQQQPAAEDLAAFEALQEIMSPTLAQESAASPPAATAAPAAEAELDVQPAAEEAQAKPEPKTWYDDVGVFWCDAEDGWRYCFDAATNQWQAHSQTPPVPPPPAPEQPQKEQPRQPDLAQEWQLREQSSPAKAAGPELLVPSPPPAAVAAEPPPAPPTSLSALMSPVMEEVEEDSAAAEWAAEEPAPATEAAVAHAVSWQPAQQQQPWEVAGGDAAFPDFPSPVGDTAAFPDFPSPVNDAGPPAFPELPLPAADANFPDVPSPGVSGPLLAHGYQQQQQVATEAGVGTGDLPADDEFGLAAARQQEWSEQDWQHQQQQVPQQIWQPAAQQQPGASSRLPAVETALPGAAPLVSSAASPFLANGSVQGSDAVDWEQAGWEQPTEQAVWPGNALPARGRLTPDPGAPHPWQEEQQQQQQQQQHLAPEPEPWQPQQQPGPSSKPSDAAPLWQAEAARKSAGALLPHQQHAPLQPGTAPESAEAPPQQRQQEQQSEEQQQSWQPSVTREPSATPARPAQQQEWLQQQVRQPGASPEPAATPPKQNAWQQQQQDWQPETSAGTAEALQPPQQQPYQPNAPPAPAAARQHQFLAPGVAQPGSSLHRQQQPTALQAFTLQQQQAAGQGYGATPQPFMPQQLSESSQAAAPTPQGMPQPEQVAYSAAAPYASQFATFTHSYVAPTADAYHVADSVPTSNTGGYSLHGRPATCFGKLLFGGRLLLVDPSGRLQLHSMALTPPELLHPLPGAPTTSLSGGLRLLESFPGPLASNTSKDKVARFCGDQAQVAGVAPLGFVPVLPNGTTPSAGSTEQRMLWSVLRVLALHQGRFSSAPYGMLPPAAAATAGGSKQQPTDPASLPEAQLAAALLGDADSRSGSASVLLPRAAPSPDAAAAASRVQQLLLEGCRAEALQVAVASQLWSVALLLSRLLGEAAISATAAAMVEQSVVKGAPLQTLLLLLGGAPPEQPLAVAAAAAAAAGEGAHVAPPAVPMPATAASAGSSGWLPGMFQPDLQAAQAAGGAAGSSSDADWQQHLAMMAANRTAGDEAAMLLLGSQLQAAGQLLPAHICFVLAGAAVQPWDLAAITAATASPMAASQGGSPMLPTPWPSASAAAAGGIGSRPAGSSTAAPHMPPLQLVLLGADAIGRPRSLAQPQHIIATEVYAWARTMGGGPAQANAFLAFTPYRLLHAHALAELGLVQAASAYCQGLTSTLQALGGKVPPGLFVCRAAAADFQDRLQQYAVGQKLSLGGNFSAGAIVSSMGKWLDRGLTAMLGSGGGSEAGSDVGRHSRKPSHSRNASTSSQDARNPTKRSASSGSLLSSAAAGSLVPFGQQPAPQQGDKKVGLFHRVSSITGILKSKPKPTAATAPDQEASPEPENVFYYDQELKMWREWGVEPLPAPEPLAPPPLASWQGGTPGSAAGSEALPTLLPANTASMPRTMAGSRYALAGSYSAQPAAGGLAPGSLLPAAPAFGAHPPLGASTMLPAAGFSAQQQQQPFEQAPTAVQLAGGFRGQAPAAHPPAASVMAPSSALASYPPPAAGSFTDAQAMADLAAIGASGKPISAPPAGIGAPPSVAPVAVPSAVPFAGSPQTSHAPAAAGMQPPGSFGGKAPAAPQSAPPATSFSVQPPAAQPMAPPFAAFPTQALAAPSPGGFIPQDPAAEHHGTGSMLQQQQGAYGVHKPPPQHQRMWQPVGYQPYAPPAPHMAAPALGALAAISHPLRTAAARNDSINSTGSSLHPSMTFADQQHGGHGWGHIEGHPPAIPLPVPEQPGVPAFADVQLY